MHLRANSRPNTIASVRAGGVLSGAVLISKLDLREPSLLLLLGRIELHGKFWQRIKAIVKVG